MGHSFIDRYSRLSSPVHRRPAHVKLLVTLVILLTTVLAPLSLWALFAGEIAFLALVAYLSRIPLSFLRSRMLFLEVFVVGIALLSLFRENGVAVFLTLFSKGTICLFAVVLFSNTTEFTSLLQLLRRWRCPDLAITVLALMYRYLFVLVDEMERMQRARTSRTFLTKRTVAWKSLATVVAQSFIRSTERAERIYAAMCARGWR
jgi:cobalt/nickel transport system permease protein